MKKRISTSILFALLTVSLLAVPARRALQEITLEDGSVIQVQLAGDEFGHWYTDCYNNHYAANEDGTWRRISEAESAQKQQIAERKRAERNENYARSTARRAVAGSNNRAPEINIAPKGLLIMVNFADVSFRATNTQAQIDSMLNAQNYSYDISIGSARKYFYDQSGGTYNPQFDVIGPITLPENMAYYGANDADDQDVMTGDLVLHACSIASGLPGVNFADYDNDGDDWVDFVYILYAGYGEADGGGDNTIWPASWDLPSAIAYGYCSLTDYYDFESYMFDGKAIGSFAFSSELSYYNSITYPTRGFTRSNPMRNGIGTFCHEFSHVIGLPDYYDTEYGYNYEQNLTPGLWSLMDGGSYNEDGEVPPSYSIYDKYFVGWAAPTLLKTPQNVSLPADGQTGYYLTANGTSATPTSSGTVYYLENRQQKGWDKGLPGHGMLVWKTKYDENKWDMNEVNNTSNSPNVIYIPADGNYSPYQGDSGDPYPGRTNVTSCAPFADYPLTEITETNGVVSFKFMGGSQCNGFSAVMEGARASLEAETTACIESGSQWNGNVVAKSGCKLTQVDVKMGDQTLENAVFMAEDALRADIRIGQVTGDIRITVATARIAAEGEEICDDYAWEAENVLLSGSNRMGDMNWTLTTGNRTPMLNYEAERGVQFGNGNKPIRQVVLTTGDATDCMVDEISIHASMTSGGDGEMSFFIGGTQVGSTQKLTTETCGYVFENSSDLHGNLEIRMTNSAMAMFLKSINIWYKPAPRTGTENISCPKAEKIVRNGRIYILKDNKTYDILGNEVR